MEKETTEEKRNEMKETGSMKLDSNNRKHNVRIREYKSDKIRTSFADAG